MNKENITGSRYAEALDFLYKQLPMFSRIGAAAYKPGLETSQQLDDYFGNPHKRFKSIHVAGTNGKGSTSHMLASILQSAGYKTGLYTSPHLVDFRERMRVDGKMIPYERVVEFVDKWKSSGYSGKPSFFELTMMMAFNWFAEENVDYAVIEVGMGGRLDSTNIITPETSVITNISHDHNQFLGNTLHEIASEKAGIIKNGIPVVIGEFQPEISQVFTNKAKQAAAPISFADQSNLINNISPDKNSGWWCETLFGNFRLPLGGEYQKKNIATVLETCRVLRDRGLEIPDYVISEGIQNVTELTGLMGRWNIISESPLTIADTGHNIGGLSYNFNQLETLIKERNDGKLRIIIGFVADKAIDKILEILPRDAVYYLTNAQIPRALPAPELLMKFNNAGLTGKVFSDVKTAYKAALKDSCPDDIIYVGGSTFIVADLLSPDS